MFGTTPKGSAMLLRRSPTVDELLQDSLIQAVMRADSVEPETLRTVLMDAAQRVAAAPLEREPRLPSGLHANPRTERRGTSQGVNRPARVHPQPLADRCGSAFCC
jgi:hypothetical protein